MAETENEEKPIGEEPPAPDIPTVTPRRGRKKKSLSLDKEKVVGHILRTHNVELESRDERITKRMARYAKLRGWLKDRDYPWPESANYWLPIMLISEMRLKATLENAVKSQRPMMQSKATQKRNQSKQGRIDSILDYQWFIENDGERKLDSLITNFVDDEAVFACAHWVKEIETMRQCKVLPQNTLPPDSGVAELLAALESLFPRVINAVMKDNDGFDWEVDYTDENDEPRRARVEYYDREDGRIEAYIISLVTVYNGPCAEVLDFEDVVFPVRSANLQPPTSYNSMGASWVDVVCKESIDTIRRKKSDATYDLISDEDLETIASSKSSTGTGQKIEEPKEAKDRFEGTQPTAVGADFEDRTIIKRFGRWDVDGDGLDEDVIFWVAEESKILLKADLLTAFYPGIPIMRPVVSESIFPIPNRVYGLSFPELLESIQEIMQEALNQHINWGELTNTPFFFYRASSGMKPEQLYLEPGIGFPLDDPNGDVSFPQFPQRDSSYAINTMTLLQQFVERISMMSDVQYGRVPTGKASALRTLGTTTALLAQGDVRSEQVLRRLFHGLGQLFTLFHRLNRNFLPDKKEYRVFGVPEQSEDAYATINNDDIDADVDFEFRSTMMNSNKQLVAENIERIAALLISPLAIQAGIVTEEEIYNLLRDEAQALEQDPDKYVKKPAQMAMGPKILAEEAISMILSGEMPNGIPLEAPQEHLDKLFAFMNSNQFGLLTEMQVGVFKTYLQRVTQLMQMQMQQQQLMAASADFQNRAGGNGNGKGKGTMTTFDENAVNRNAPLEPNEMNDGEMR